MTAYDMGAVLWETNENDLTQNLQILKLDVTSGTTKCWSEADCSPSEPVFVPHPNALAEDDGKSTHYWRNIASST